MENSEVTFYYMFCINFKIQKQLNIKEKETLFVLISEYIQCIINHKYIGNESNNQGKIQNKFIQYIRYVCFISNQYINNIKHKKTKVEK